MWVQRLRTAGRVDRLDPTLDVVFKLLLTRNRELLHHMLEAVLDEPIAGLEVLNPELPGELSIDKSVELDVRVLLESGARVDVEMQIRYDDALADRFVYYVARDHAGQLRKGDGFDKLTPTIAVIWMVEPLFPELEQYHSVFELRERRTSWLFSPQLALHVLQLAYLGISDREARSAREEAVRRWGRFFVAKTEAEFNTLAEEDSTMSAARTALDELSRDPDTARIARDREDSMKFYRMDMVASERKGRLESILAVLAARGIAVSDRERARVVAETDATVLSRWLVRAATVSSIDEVLRD